MRDTKSSIAHLNLFSEEGKLQKHLGSVVGRAMINWVKSSQPRKQRKAYFNAPLHKRHKFVTAPLSKELQRQLGIKRLPVRKGDTVLIVRGDFKGIKGKVVKVDLNRVRIYVEGATIRTASGETVYYPIHPSKVVIVELDLSDPRRKEIIEKIRRAREQFLKRLQEAKQQRLRTVLPRSAQGASSS